MNSIVEKARNGQHTSGKGLFIYSPYTNWIENFKNDKAITSFLLKLIYYFQTTLATAVLYAYLTKPHVYTKLCTPHIH